MPRQFFASTKTPKVIVEFSALMQWVQNNDQFTDEAKSEFASVADGWVVAYAKAYDLVVVTQEVYAADVKKRVPIPNVCRGFGVPYQDTFAFLRALNARFEWAKP
jgi:DNA polymerase III epsilon subunit-like protein